MKMKVGLGVNISISRDARKVSFPEGERLIFGEKN
jgi:hypothetical protein